MAALFLDEHEKSTYLVTVPVFLSIITVLHTLLDVMNLLNLKLCNPYQKLFMIKYTLKTSDEFQVTAMVNFR